MHGSNSAIEFESITHVLKAEHVRKGFAGQGTLSLDAASPPWQSEVSKMDTVCSILFIKGIAEWWKVS